MRVDTYMQAYTHVQVYRHTFTYMTTVWKAEGAAGRSTTGSGEGRKALQYSCLTLQGPGLDPGLET